MMPLCAYLPIELKERPMAGLPPIIRSVTIARMETVWEEKLTSALEILLCKRTGASTILRILKRSPARRFLHESSIRLHVGAARRLAPFDDFGVDEFGPLFRTARVDSHAPVENAFTHHRIVQH